MAGAAPALVAIAVGRMSDVGGAVSERIDGRGRADDMGKAQSTRAGPGVSDIAHVHGYSYRILRALGAHIGHTCSLPSHARAARVWHECLDTYSIVGPPRVRMVIFSSYRAACAVRFTLFVSFERTTFAQLSRRCQKKLPCSCRRPPSAMVPLLRRHRFPARGAPRVAQRACRIAPTRGTRAQAHRPPHRSGGLRTRRRRRRRPVRRRPRRPSRPRRPWRRRRRHRKRRPSECRIYNRPGANCMCGRAPMR